MLRGLSPEESKWLERKARHLHGLDAALRFLLRQGLLCDFVIQDREQKRTGAATDAHAYAQILAHAERLRPVAEAPPSVRHAVVRGIE